MVSLNSDNPDVDKERIIDALEELAKLHMEPPIYYNSIDYAIEHDEINAFYASSITYKDCKMAIDDAICRHFDGHHLGADCMEEVVNNFSPERVKNVLAYTVQSNEWDGRFSRDNKEWAKSVDTEHMGILAYQYVVNSHPAVLDGFISMFRREVLEHGADEKNADKPAHKSKERDDDLEL